jgi:hypothetical protein
MTSKFSFGLAANDRPEHASSDGVDGDDGVELASDPGTEIMVDASEDVTVEAQEDVTTEASGEQAPSEMDADRDGGASMVTPAPFTAEGPEARPVNQTLLGMMAPSLPLPGVTAPSGLEDSEDPISLGPEIASEDEDDDEITVMARPVDRLVNMDASLEDVQALGDRPSITEDEEEETKVEPAETAARAAASRDDDDDDDLSAALSEQASLEREKALRKSASFASLASASSGADSDDLEFADPDDEEAVGPGDLLEDGEDDGDSVGTFPKSAEPSPLAAAFTARRLGSPPLGTPFGTRLPTPSPGFGGLSLASPVQVPAPTSSPFGRLPAPGASPGSRISGLGTALQIPAPSGSTAAAQAGSPSAIFRKVSIPVVGLLASGAAVLGLGFLFGYQVSGSRAPVVVATPAAPPAVQPVRNASTPTTTTDTPAVPTAEKSAAADSVAVPIPAAPAAKPIAEPIVAESPAAAARPAKRVVTRPKKAVDDDEEQTVASKPVAKSSTSKPKSVKPSKGWVDPFAD